MTDRKMLVDIIVRTPCVSASSRAAAEHIADHLIANGVVVREKGEWIPYDYDICGCRNVGERCSWCGYEICQTKYGVYNFCNNCGADMRKGENDG